MARTPQVHQHTGPGDGGESLAPDQINTIQEFYTPSDGKLHTVDASTLKSLMDSYDVIVCPPEQSVTFSSTKSLNKTDHDDLTLVCPYVQNPHRANANGFVISAGGDFSLISIPTTEDIGGLTIFGVSFDGGGNTTAGTALLSLGDGFVNRVERCKFRSGDGPGIEITGTWLNSRIVDNRFLNSTDSHILITGQADAVKITGNYIGEAGTGNGIRFSGTTVFRTLVADNIVRGPDGIGIELNTNDQEDIYVYNNLVHNTGSFGIHARDNYQPIISNFVFGCGDHGIQAPKVAVGNYCLRNDGAGIALNGNSVCVGNTCQNNAQATSNAGILCREFQSDFRVAWNACVDTQSTATQEHGIEIIGNDAVIGPNQLNGNATAAFSDSGTRTVFTEFGAPIGQNAGSPASGGDWNGNGRRGVIVEDTNNAGDAYIFLPNAGAWSQIST